MTKYIFKNESGQYWTGECWGVRQAAQDYEEEGLPEMIDGYQCVDNTLDPEQRIWINEEIDDSATIEEITSPVA